MTRRLLLSLTTLLCFYVLPFEMHLNFSESASARAARDLNEQKKAIAASVAYIRETALQSPIKSVSGGNSLTVYVERDWFSISNSLRQAFADRIKDLALVGNGGIAIPIEIIVGRKRVAVSAFSSGTLSMLLR